MLEWDSDVESEDSEQYKLICAECDTEIEGDDYKFQCDSCEQYFCDSCPDEIFDMNYCNTIDCYYCKRGYCFNTIILNRYCEACVPQSVLDKNEYQERIEKEMDEQYWKIKNTRPFRLTQLTFLLKQAGLELRDDSKLCKKYINTAEGDPSYIVERMSQMKFLFEYCNMQKVLDEVSLKQEEEWESGYIPDCTVFDEAEYTILEKTPYPKIWPWQLDKYARIIQRGCYNWLWKPITDDGKIGINARLGMRQSGIGDFLYESEIDSTIRSVQM